MHYALGQTWLFLIVIEDGETVISASWGISTGDLQLAAVCVYRQNVHRAREKR